MDYEFWFEGNRPQARVDDDQALFGVWLTEEIADDLRHLKAILTTSELILQGGLRDYRHQGKNILLQLTREEAQITAHSLLHDEDIDLEDDNLSLQDFDQQADCGLEDFIEVLQAWKQHIAG